MENNEKGVYSSESSRCSDDVTTEKLNTRLIESIPDGDITHMKRILAMGASPNASCHLDHVSACHIAAMFDNDALDLLLSSGADSSLSDQYGRTPLHLAAWAGNVKHIAALLNFPEALRKSVADHVVLSPETVAEVTRHSLPVNKLINAACRRKVKSTLHGDWSDSMEHNCDSIKKILPELEQEWTALHAASARAQHHCVQFLLAAGADATAQDQIYRTPLDVAGSAYYSGHKIDVNNFMETVDLLLKEGGKFFSCNYRLDSLSTPLHTAVELRSTAAVKQMLQAGASATMWNPWGFTAMHVCVQKRDKELLQVLAFHKRGKSNLASIDVIDRTGSTVLCMAVKVEWLEGVRIALAAGATNINYFETGIHSRLDESTVFHLATRLGSKDVLELLLNYYKHEEVKKHINTSDNIGLPLYIAIRENHVDCARLLICKGAELNQAGYNRLLDLAVENNNTLLAEMIIKADVETLPAAILKSRAMENNDKGVYSSEPFRCSDDVTTEKLNTRLIESIPDGDITHMKRIIAMGASPNASCHLDHVSACHIAVMFDNDALDLLLSSGADSFRSDQYGRTPLHLAAWAGNVKHIAALLNFPEALTKSVADHVVLSPETVAEVTRHSLPVNKLINAACRRKVKSTLPGDWSDSMEHNCDSIKKILPELEQEWTALHAASARAQHHCVQFLLAAGADASAQDQIYRTPLDVAGSAYYSGHKIDVNNFMETVDLLLKEGGKFFSCYYRLNNLSTPLHTAVELRSKAAVKQMLQAGASATMWNPWGFTAMHVCVQKRDKELLQVLAFHKRGKSNLASIDVIDRTGSTVLCMAVKVEWLEGVRIALAAGATNINYFETGIHSRLDESTVFHLATRLGSKDVLELLLNYYYHEEVKRHINTSDNFGLPLYIAIRENHVDCARLLICKGAELNLDGHNRLLNLAVENNNTVLAEMIIEADVETLHAVNREGRSPLYEACSHRHREMIALLLRKGADLSGGEKEIGKKFVPIENLMNNFSQPTEFMQDIFDSNIESFLQKDDYDEVFVNFQVLSPKYDRKKMKVIQALLNTGNIHDQQKLLLHPLVESFLFLQWKSLLPFFYIILALHACFVLSLNVFTLSLFWFRDREIEVPIVFHCGVWIYIIYLATFLLTVQDFIIIQMKTIRYRLCLETSVKCLSTIFAVVLPQVVSWDSKSNPEWVRLFGSVTLLLAWVRIMYLLSRLPDCGYYVLMYGKVAFKVFRILVSFGLLIVGFSLSFMIHFHAQEPFEDPLSSLLTTMVMMTSELGYNEIINKKSGEQASASLIMIRLIFVSFLILVSIILMNLLVGVAVNDINTLEIIGNINRLKKQVQFIKSFEDTACNHYIANILPASLYKSWLEDNIPRELYVRKRQTRDDNHGLPTRLIEAIFENVQLQKCKSHKKLDTELYQTKLDEIHEVIVPKDSAGTKPEIPDYAKILEEIIKLRSDMEVIKNHTGKNSLCSNCSNP